MTIEKFETMYQNDFLPVLKDLESRRRKHFIKTILQLIILIAVYTSAMLIFESEHRSRKTEEKFYPIWGATGAFSLSMILFFMAARRRAIISDYKYSITPLIVNSMRDGFKYHPDAHTSHSYFVDSDLFPLSPDRFTGEDFFEGIIGNVYLEFSEVHASHKVSDKNYQKIFSGLLMRADFNKNAKGKVIVLPDKSEKLFGKIAQTFQAKSRKGCELIKLENIEFEKLFKVYASDQVIGRFVLSSALMERIVNFQKRSENPISLSVINSCLYIAIPYKRNLFDPSIWRSMLDKGLILTFIEDLELFFSIVEELDLNTRIWGVD